MLRLRRGVVVVASLAAIAFGQSMVAGGPVALAASSTIYVDRNALNCSDTVPGTQSVPNCTIGAAAAFATAGTSVVVNPGTYPEEVKVMHSGTQGAPITFAPASPASVTISGQLHGFTVTNRSWITISGFIINNTSNYGIYLDTSADIIVDGNQVSLTGKPFSGQTAAGIHLTATTDSLIENNTIHDTTWAGIELYSDSVRVEVRHNVISKSAAGWTRAAVGIDVESASATVDYNITHDNEDSGIQFYKGLTGTGGDNGIAFDNVSYNNGDHGIDNHNVTGGVLNGNVIYHNCTTGINVEGTSGNIKIENNIAVDNAVYPAYNNISCTRGTGNIGVASSSIATTTADYNLVNLTTGTKFYVWAGAPYSTLAAFQTATGQEAHGIWLDPKWVNSAGGDFHLQAGSPAIDSANAGAPAEPTTDIDGNPRRDDPATLNTGAGPRDYDDRGAYEFQPNVSDNQPPTVPASLAATSSTSKPLQVSLSWTASNDNVGVAGYTVYRGGIVLADPVSGTTYTDAAVTEGTKYTYTVDAFDATGDHSAQSAAATVTTPDLTPPSVPTSVSATALTTRQVNVGWAASTDNVGVTGYTVYRNGTLLTTVSGSTLTYADKTVADVTPYSYTVDAFDAAGNHSAQSTAANVTTPDYTPPSVPTGVSATALSTPQVSVSWSASTDNVGVTGYTIYRNGTALGTVSGSTLTYTDSTVASLTSYSYTVDAFDAAGNHSAQSTAANVTTPNYNPPTVPTGLSATTGTTTQQVTLSWNASTDKVGVTGYTVYRGGVSLGTVSGSTLTYVDNTVANLTNYSYTVDAFDAAGAHSAPSAPAVVTTPQISYFNWFDLTSPGMVADNIHLLNASGSPANVKVSMPGASPITVMVPAGAETYVTFGKGHLGGPVVVTADQAIRASQRVQYYSTFNEVWAESSAQAAMTSYINWYDKASAGMFNDNIHLVNPNSTSVTVTVSLPGAPSRTAIVGPGLGSYVTFPAGTVGGPVTVSSTLPVLASQRVQYFSSFNEVWAESAAQAATTSYVNWYDKASSGMFNDNIHLLNPNGTSATVTVSLSGAPSQTAVVPAGGETYVMFPVGTMGGPVKITSTQPILASQRVQFYSTFNEVWSASAAQSAATSYVNWFDKASPGMFNDNIHLLNPGSTSATVTVSLPGAPTQTKVVPAGGETYVTFPVGTTGGAVVISSTQPILASQRVQYYSSFNEIWSG